MPEKLTRLQRAKAVRDRIVELAAERGKWRRIPIGENVEARSLEVKLDWGKALISSRFSGLPTTVTASTYDDALNIQRLGQPGFDLMVDLFHDDIGKVLSISTINGDDKLIGMNPGPWEADFGLPKRAWPPALSRELSGKLSRP